MKKKILFLSPLPPPQYGSAMSSERCLQILEDHKNFEVKNIKLNFATEMQGIGKIKLSKVSGVFSIQRKALKALKTFKPDIVYVVPATTSLGLVRDAYIVNSIAQRFTGPIILHLRSRVLEKDWNTRFSRKIITRMLQQKKIIILGEALRGDLHDLVPKKDVYKLPNAIDNEISDKKLLSIQRKRTNEKTLQLLFLSNMDVTKGWMKVLEACRILKEQKFSFHCHFAGSWQSKQDETTFVSFIKKHKLSKDITYHGNVGGSDKIKLLSQSEVLLFPTEYPLETFGRVIIEGMMFGVPVIANGIATIPQIIDDNKTGFVLKKNTPQEIAQKITELKKRSIRSKMGLLGRKRFLKQFEMKRYEQSFIKILQDVQ